MARVVIINDRFFPGVLEGFLGNGHDVIYVQTLNLIPQEATHRLECYTPATGRMQWYNYQAKSLEQLTDDELQGCHAVFVDGRLVGWRLHGADADLTGIDLTRELRNRGYTGKIFANSGNPNLNRLMVEAGADGVADSDYPFKSLDASSSPTTASPLCYT